MYRHRYRRQGTAAPGPVALVRARALAPVRVP